MSAREESCGKDVFVTPWSRSTEETGSRPPPPNRAARRSQKKEKLSRKCSKPRGHKGECDRL